MINFNKISNIQMAIMEKPNKKNKNRIINQQKLNIIRLQMTNCQYKKLHKNLKLNKLFENNEKQHLSQILFLFFIIK